MENLNAFIEELAKLHHASKNERDEARDRHKALEKVAKSAGTLLRDLENLQSIERSVKNEK